MKHVRRLRAGALHALVLVICCSAMMRAQNLVDMPDGEPVVSVEVFNVPQECRLSATRNTIYFATYFSGSGWSANTVLATVPVERRIVDAALKRGETGVLRSYVVALDDGSTLEYVVNTVAASMEGAGRYHAAPPGLQLIQLLNQGIQVKRILFDNTKVMLLGTLLYTDDIKVLPWRIDSAGMANVAVNDVTMDSDGTLLAATSNGLFRRSNVSNSWSRVPGIDSTIAFTTVFATRTGAKIYAASANAVYSRETGSSTFSVDSLGLQRAPILRFVDDAQEFVYAVGAISDRASSLFRRAAHAKSWTRIDAAFNATTKSTLRIFDVTSQHTLECATAAGCWSSTDNGDTWKYSSDSIKAEDIYGFQSLTDGSLLVSTAAAMYRKHGAWTKVFPQNGFAGARPLERGEKSGTVLATQLGITTVNPVNQPDIYRSLDHGVSWIPDTAGLSVVPVPNTQNGNLFVSDHAARQYIVLSGSQGQPLSVYSTPWSADTIGLNMPSGQNGTQLCLGLNFDANNTAYLSTGMFTTFQFILQQSSLYSRASARTDWTLDTAGLGGLPVSAVCGNGVDTWAGTLLGDNGSATLFRKVNNQWQNIPAPRAAVSDVSHMCVDSSKVLYVSFDGLLNNGQLRQGVYATADNGKTWEYAGCAGSLVRQLVATRDAVYAATNHGVVELSRQPYHPAIAQFNIHDLDFGTIDMGTTRDTVVHIANVGTDTLRVNFLRTNSRNFSATPFNFIVAPGTSEAVTIHFAPVQSGALSARLQCVANSIPDTIAISGFAHAADAHISLQSKFIIFGLVDIGTHKDTTIQIRNTGTEDLKIFNITSTNAVFSAIPTQLTVAPNTSQDVILRFTPQSGDNVNGVMNFIANTLPDSLRVLGVGVLLSVEDDAEAKAMGLKVQPNPTSLDKGMISLEVKHSGKLNIRVSNEQGVDVGQRFTAEVESGHFELPLNSIVDTPQTGVLFIHVQSPDGRAVVKCVVE